MVGFTGIVERHESKSTVKLPLLNDPNAHISLSELTNRIPELRDGASFSLHPLLFTGDLQTIYLGIADFSREFPVHYGRRVIHFKDGGSTAADFVLQEPQETQEWDTSTKEIVADDRPALHPRTRFLSPKEIEAQHSIDTRPTVLVLHGLGGGSHVPNTRSLCHTFTKDHGFEAVVLHTRGCGGSKLTTPELFSGLATEDIRHFVKILKTSYPNRPIYAVGLSFGGALLANYLAEEGDKSEIVAAAALSSPWDFVDSAHHIESRTLSNILFKSVIAGYLSEVLQTNRKELEESPFFSKKKLDAKYNSVVEFDNAITAPFYGFDTAFDYYRAASPVSRLKHVRTPLLIINSRDDPIVGVQSIPVLDAAANPYITLASTNIGGHVAYVQSDGNLWSAKQIGEFFRKVHETVDTSKPVILDHKGSFTEFQDRSYRRCY